MEIEINHNNQNKNNSDAGVVYLHGDLDLTIIEARSLPNMDLVSEHLRRFLSFLTSCTSPNHRHHTDDHHSNSKMLLRKKNNKIITSDPYVTVCLAGATVARTRVISNSTNPVWNEHLNVPVAHPVSHIEFYVKDDDVFGADVIGVASVSVRDLIEGKEIEDWFPIVGSNGKPPKPDAAIHVRMRFVSCYRNLIDNCDNSEGRNEPKIMHAVRRSYFPERKGGSVMLYQDAHVREETSLPKIGLDNGGVFEQGKCWEDVCHAILEAHHLVYVVGWSIYHKVRLVREPTRPLPSGGELTLGDLLKYKSQEGVRVLLLVWDDKTSHSKFFINTVVGTLYTHHQKCVIVDTQASGNNRKLTAFLGGLDMCDGRYDTPEHRLCRDLDTTFQDDYHNPTFTVSS
ncbi:Phospholipase D delta-like protein [Drosera capensis]